MFTPACMSPHAKVSSLYSLLDLPPATCFRSSLGLYTLRPTAGIRLRSFSCSLSRKLRDSRHVLCVLCPVLPVCSEAAIGGCSCAVFSRHSLYVILSLCSRPLVPSGGVSRWAIGDFCPKALAPSVWPVSVWSLVTHCIAWRYIIVLPISCCEIPFFYRL